jgi:hypothetical protein
MVDCALIGWREHLGGLWRSTSGYSAKLNEYVTRRDEFLVEIKKAKAATLFDKKARSFYS